MKQVLMVAEKPSLAQTLSSFLSEKRAFRAHNDRSKTKCLPMFEWDAPWPETGEMVHYKMTSTYGHVNEIDFELPYCNDWQTDPENLFTCGIVKKERDPKAGTGRQLTAAGRGVDCLVLWLDCDKEGENICFEVMNYIIPVMKTQSGLKEKVYRAQFSALTEKDVQTAMHNLRLPNRDVASSVDARMELDLRIGCAFTRLQTKYFKAKYGREALQTNTVPFGPCQTPTLAFCVERHLEIENFRPQPFWQIKLDVEIRNSKGHSGVSTLQWKRKRVFDFFEAEFFFRKLKGQQFIRVKNVKTEEKRKLCPTALNTVQLLRLSSTHLSISPSETMQIAERLYMDGFISYPRTETTEYPKSFDRISTLTAIGGDDKIGQFAEKLIYETPNSRRSGEDRGDHPPIIPLKKASFQQKNQKIQKNQKNDKNDKKTHDLFELICMQFLASLSSDCVFLEKTVYFDVEGECFHLEGIEVLHPGFTEILKNQRLHVKKVPKIEIGSLIPIRNCSLNQNATKPPEYLTESDLIDLMEKHEIGTDASIPVHIQNVFKRNFASLDRDRRIHPTPMGVALIGAYSALDEDLVKPQIRSTLERDLCLIAERKAKKQEIMDHVLKIYRAKFQYLAKNISIMDDAIAGTLHLTPSKASRHLDGRRREDEERMKRRLKDVKDVKDVEDVKDVKDDRTAKRLRRAEDDIYFTPLSGRTDRVDRVDRVGQASSQNSRLPTVRLHNEPSAPSTSSVSTSRSIFPSSLNFRPFEDPTTMPTHWREMRTANPHSSSVSQSLPQYSANSIRPPVGQTSTQTSTQTFVQTQVTVFRPVVAAKPLPSREQFSEDTFDFETSILYVSNFPPQFSVKTESSSRLSEPVVKVEGEVQNQPLNVVCEASGGGVVSGAPSVGGRKLFLECGALQGYTVADGKDPVQVLYEICQKAKMCAPEFRIVREAGAPHSKEFVYEVVAAGEGFGPFTAASKKEAMKGVAKLCLLQCGFIKK